MITNAKLAWRLLRRDARAGELHVLAAALVIAVASVGSVGFFTDRVKAALAQGANQLLGADLLLSGDRPLPESFAIEARNMGLTALDSVRFNSMTQNVTSGAAILTEVKAVQAGYPLRGQITLFDAENSAGRPTRDIPNPGSIWIDSRLQTRLQLKVGDNISLGERQFSVSAIIKQEPEVSGSFLNLGPKLTMNLADLPATQLIQPGTRARFRLLIAGRDIARYRSWAEPYIGAGQRIETIRDLRPEVKDTLERAEKFLGLAALVAVILAAVAVALATGRYLRRHLDACAMMRCLGAPQRQILTLYVVQFLLLGLLASLLGCLLALLGQQLLVFFLGFVVTTELPWPGLLPAGQAIATGMLLLLGFALPPLLSLAKVSPLRVLRRDLGLPRFGGLLAYLFGIAAIAALVLWQARDLKVGLLMLGGIAAVLLTALFIAWLLLVLVRLVPQRGYNWRYGLANLRRRPLASSMQIATLGLGMMALLLLSLVRSDLLQNWRASLPADAPNKFLINIQPEQVAELENFFTSNGYPSLRTYPMVRGRLIAINEQPVSPADYVNERAKRLIDREFNLSWSETMPSANRIIAGRWWKSGESGGLSLEEGIAQTLNIKLNDRLTYDIAGQSITAQVTSLRKVDWGSFRVNFFAILPPKVLDDMPKSYITAFSLPEESEALLARLIQQFPNLLLIDVSEVMREVQKIINQVSRAVEFVFFFTLLAGLLVLQAAITSTQDERRFDAAVLRTLGANQKQLRAAQLTEFLILGALAGLLAAGGASALSYVLSDKVFRIPYQFAASLWVIGLLCGAIGVALAGWLGTRSTLRQPPLVVIRQLA